MDCVIVDAGADDAALAMSCPPAAFLGQGFLGSAAVALRPDGLLAVNCVARARAPLEAAVRALQARSGLLFQTLEVFSELLTVAGKMLRCLPCIIRYLRPVHLGALWHIRRGVLVRRGRHRVTFYGVKEILNS